MFKNICFVLCILLSSFVNANTSPPPATEDFSRYSQYRNITVSPSGDYLAVEMITKEGKGSLAILDSKSLTILGHIPATGGNSPIYPVWISNTRLVCSFTRDLKSREYEAYTGELLAFDYNGKNQKKIIQHQRAISAGKNKKLNSLHGAAEVIHILPKEKKHVLIRFTPFKRNNSDFEDSKVYKINTMTGKLKLIATAESNYAAYTFDKKNKLRYSLGVDKTLAKKENKFVIHQFVNKKWKKLTNLALKAEELYLLGTGDTPEEIYLEARYKDSTNKVYLYNVKTQEKSLVFNHPKVDPAKYIFDQYTKDLIAIYFDDKYVDVFPVKPEHPEITWLGALFNNFPEQNIEIVSASQSGEKMIVKTWSNTSPYQFYLFNTKSKSIKYLLNSREWIKPEQAAKTQRIEITARDNLKIQTLLTLPKDAKSPVPLVVLPHGGPHGIRDTASYNSEVQFLASRGYAVLRVNYRGSGGYGLGFVEAGYKQWGAKIQYDIIDATKEISKKPLINSDKICIFGASFGGYSALMAPTIEPNLYKCAIAYVGIYDLENLHETGDIPTAKYGKNFLNDAVGHNKQQLIDYSPVHQAHKLKAPVLLIHGENDNRAHISHYELMKNKLEKLKHPLEAVLFEGEGHGLASEKNRAILLEKVEGFLEKHL